MADDTYLQLVDGEVRAVDLSEMMRRHRAAVVKARADAVDQAADLFCDPAFDIAETYSAADAVMPAAMTDAAANVALALREVELGGP